VFDTSPGDAVWEIVFSHDKSNMKIYTASRLTEYAPDQKACNVRTPQVEVFTVTILLLIYVH
jgi:hypothetical protein